MAACGRPRRAAPRMPPALALGMAPAALETAGRGASCCAHAQERRAPLRWRHGGHLTRPGRAARRDAASAETCGISRPCGAASPHARPAAACRDAPATPCLDADPTLGGLVLQAGRSGRRRCVDLAPPDPLLQPRRTALGTLAGSFSARTAICCDGPHGRHCPRWRGGGVARGIAS